MSSDDRRDQLLAVAETALPDQPIATVTELRSDGPSLVGKVSAESGKRFVLKTTPTRVGRSRLRVEAAATNVVGRRTAVPVPEIVAADVDPVDGGQPYLLFEWVDGQTLGEAMAAAPSVVHGELFRHLGATVARLHAGFSFRDPGRLLPDGLEDIEVQPADSWPVLFAEELAAHANALGGTRFEALADDVWDHVRDRLQRLQTGDAPVLLHGDIGDGNVIYDGVTPVSVLDWEHAFAGHPEYDLCRAELRYFWNQWGQPDRLQSALYAGYRSQRPLGDDFDDRRPLYLATFYLQTLSTYEEWGPRYTTDLDGLASKVAAKVRGLLEPPGPPEP